MKIGDQVFWNRVRYDYIDTNECVFGRIVSFDDNMVCVYEEGIIASRYTAKEIVFLPKSTEFFKSCEEWSKIHHPNY